MLLMIRRDVYVIQPYEVGTKERKSLALIIPAQIAREYNVNRSTVLALSINEKEQKITLQKLNVADLKNIMIGAAADSVEASSLQSPSSSGTQ